MKLATSLKNRKKSIVHEDMQLQRAIWTAERIAWGLMALFVLLALAGALSLGFLSKAETATDDGALHLSFERILRSGRSYDFVVTGSGLQPGGETALTVGGLDPAAQTVELITPEPSGHEAGRDATVLHFTAAQDGSLRVAIRIRPERPRTGELRFSLPGKSPLNARFFVLP